MTDKYLELWQCKEREHMLDDFPQPPQNLSTIKVIVQILNFDAQAAY